MKHSIIAVAALAVTSAVSAQTTPISAEIFGIVDAAYSVGVGDVSNRTRLTSGSMGTSRLGFRGERAISPNLKASFWIEAGVNSDSGAGQATNSNNQTATPLADAGTQGVMFNRRATVSLAGGFGEVRLGRDYTPHYWNHAVYDPFGNVGVGASRAYVASAAGVTFGRASNTIAYFTPSFGGFQVQGQTYFGENASTAADVGSGSSIRAVYGLGPLSLGLAYGKTTTGANTDVQYSNVGGSYDFGVAKVMLFASKEANTNVANLNGYLMGATLPAGPGYVRASASTADNGTAKTMQYVVGYVYNLDKKTDVYATVATLNNSGGASAALNAATTKADRNSSGFDIGIKYVF